MATTPRGIETPDLGTAYNPPVDLAVMADSIDTIVSGLEDVNTERSNYGVGTTSERTAALASFPNGAKWYDTTLSAEYRKVAGAWEAIPAVVSPGLVPITPSSVAGTGVSLSGSQVIASAATSISVNGCFTAGYDHYKVFARLASSAASGSGMTLRASGTNATTAYDRQRVSGVSASASAAQVLNGSSWEMVAALLIGTHVSEITLSNPADAIATVGTLITASTDNPMTVAAGINNAAIQHRTATAYDGFTITPASGTLTGYIQIVGVSV